MKLKVAIIGARGIGNYGGFENAVMQIAPGLVNLGLEVICSSEKNYDVNPPTFFGVEIRYFPRYFPKQYSIRKLYEILYDVYFLLNTTKDCDSIYLLGCSAGVATILPRLFNKRIIVNVDGLEWQRSKFGLMTRSILKLQVKLSCLFANDIIIDNDVLIDAIPRKFRNKCIKIPYGIGRIYDNESSSPVENIDHVEIKKIIDDGNYWLIVARLEPENSILQLIKGYLDSNSNNKLLIVGSYSDQKYKKKIDEYISNNKSENRILFLGSIYNSQLLLTIRQNAYGYLHGHTVGGTNPSLLEAIGCKNVIIAHKNKFNIQVCDNFIGYFSDEKDLSFIIKIIESNYSQYKQKSLELFERNKHIYDWNKIIEKYLYLFNNELTDNVKK